MAYARPLARPGFPARANTIAQRKGLAYQKAVCKALLGHSGAWFEFEDAIGPGICQPDLYFTLGGEARALALVEIKLTYTQEALDQLLRLYSPVLALAFHLPVFPVVICKNLTPRATALPICGDFASALRASRPGLPSICHWLGASPLPLAPPAGGFTSPWPRIA